MVATTAGDRPASSMPTAGTPGGKDKSDGFHSVAQKVQPDAPQVKPPPLLRASACRPAGFAAADRRSSARGIDAAEVLHAVDCDHQLVQRHFSFFGCLHEADVGLWDQPVAIGTVRPPFQRRARCLEHATQLEHDGILNQGCPAHAARTQCRNARMPTCFGKQVAREDAGWSEASSNTAGAPSPNSTQWAVGESGWREHRRRHESLWQRGLITNRRWSAQ